MYLKQYPALAFTNLLIRHFRHRLAIEPGGYLIAFNTDLHSVPVAHFKDLLFFIRNLVDPAATVRFIYTACILSGRRNFNLPSRNADTGFYIRTDEYTAVAVSFLF